MRKKYIKKAIKHARQLIDEAIALEDVYITGITGVIHQSNYGLTWNEAKQLVEDEYKKTAD